MLSLASLIGTHGYWVLFIGCLLEGETVLLLAGFAAHRGFLDPIAVIAVAATAGFIGDQLFFWLGRRHGAAVLRRFPALDRQSARFGALVDRYHALMVIGMRFAYGLRIAGPVLMGTTSIRSGRFALLNASGAVLWACSLGAIGWLFGQVAESLLGEIRHLEGWLLLALALLAAAAWWWRRRRAGGSSSREPPPAP